eukprot:TRINITY_DN715_c0_g1_i2.p1 TRINITY_DN715_c0_g1~~TRINITY_DN715_c0_g1_i2.p1  ORF type:complete len:225 (+),score=33.30 TRINITY_DN715_c0_g1_i2:404-1078(+)
MSALSRTEAAHQKYREGRYEDALLLYSTALGLSSQKSHRIALHSNRAACYLKIQSFKQAAEECSAVLELDPRHTGALMLRAQTLVALKDYQSALFDVNRLIEINPSSDAYRNLQARLRSQLALAPIPESESEVLSESESMSPPYSPNSRVLGSTSPTTTLPSQPKDVPVAEVKGWDAIAKPKGHSGVDYSRWGSVGDDLSSDEEEDDSQPQYAYRLRTLVKLPT